MLDSKDEYTVTQLSNMIKKTIEVGFRDVRLKGEVAGLKVHSSGHTYFTLKDEQSNIDCICWKYVSCTQKVKLEDGIEIRCVGKVTTYSERSKYQFIVSSFELAGEGALLKLLEERKKRLAADGVFDLDKKQPIPRFPKLIGVITSPTGAVIQDIMHRIEDRFPTPILLYPVLVQGAQAAGQVVHGIKYMNSLPKDRRPDVLIIARGGGSLEDLMPFNDEELARVASRSGIPIISAIGHETDTSLLDFAADLRAPTPTAAAELAVQHRNFINEMIYSLFIRMNNYFKKEVSTIQTRLDSCKVLSPGALLENKMQKLDLMFVAFERCYMLKLDSLSIMLSRIKVNKPEIVNMKIDTISTRLDHSINDLISSKSSSMFLTINMLESCSTRKIFQRGYAYIECGNGLKVRSKYDIQNGNTLNVFVSDGNVEFSVNNVVIN